MAGLLQRINCVETPSGFLLTWDIADGAEIAKTTVYGLNSGRQFVIEQPFIPTRRCLVAPSNYNLIDSFKLVVVDTYGVTDDSGPISPQRMQKAERLLLNDIRRRNLIHLKASPIGSYPAKILFKRIDGPACECCGVGICGSAGGTGASEYCPICLGTGIADPFILYPETELFHGHSPHDDQPVSQAEVQRSHIIRQFRSVFDLKLLSGDVFVSGTEVYKIIKQDITASVGGVPAAYMLTAAKMPPEDPKYDALISLSKGGSK